MNSRNLDSHSANGFQGCQTTESVDPDLTTRLLGPKSSACKSQRQSIYWQHLGSEEVLNSPNYEWALLILTKHLLQIMVVKVYLCVIGHDGFYVMVVMIIVISMTKAKCYVPPGWHKTWRHSFSIGNMLHMCIQVYCYTCCFKVF